MARKTKATKLIERLDKYLQPMFGNKRHLNDAADRVFMAAIREGADLNALLDLIETDRAFQLTKFSRAKDGNIFDYVEKDYRECSKHFVNIQAGSNGGMASIGRGEFFISFLSNFKVKVIKGNADLEYTNKTNNKLEELKFNGGKIAVDGQRGEQVWKKMKTILSNRGKLKLLVGKDFVPFRKTDKKLYKPDEINYLNAVFWEALTDRKRKKLTDLQLKILCLKRAFEQGFKNFDSILIIDEDGSFVRFTNSKDAVEYYTDIIRNNRWNRDFTEFRTGQSNIVGIYLFSFK